MGDVCEKHGLKLLTYGTLVSSLPSLILLCIKINFASDSAGDSWLMNGLDNLSQKHINRL